MVVENAEGVLQSVQEAEQRVIAEIQKLGQSVLQGWATRQNKHQKKQFVQSNNHAYQSRKNTLRVYLIR